MSGASGREGLAQGGLPQFSAVLRIINACEKGSK